jgi:hypothetical protein
MWQTVFQTHMMNKGFPAIEKPLARLSAISLAQVGLYRDPSKD